MIALPHEASVYREVSLQILMMLGEALQDEKSHFSTTPGDVATLVYAVQHLDEIAVLADDAERAHDIAREAERLASLAQKVVA